MEERLFYIGIAMFAYAYATRWGMKSGRLDKRGATSLWHAAFCALAGFSVGLVAMMSMETRDRFSAPVIGALSEREILCGIFLAIVAGAWGATSAWRSGKSAKERSKYHEEDLEWADTFSSALVLASLMMYFVVQAFKIPSGSMKNTLLIGDHLFVNKFVYGTRIPLTTKRVLPVRRVRPGDVVVFRFPTEDKEEQHCGSPQYNKDFIKRVIGLPGDEIRVVGETVYRNGEKVALPPNGRLLPGMIREKDPHPLAHDQYQKLWETRKLDDYVIGNYIRDDFGPVRVPDGDYFMMGDNRDESCDSRFWGPVPDHYIKGQAWFIYWPPSRMGTIH